MVLLLVALIFAFRLGPLSATGIIAVVALLAYEHSLVSKDDLSKLNAAFFTMNGVIAVVFFVFVALDLLLRRSGRI
jgi:4-hydroxybenzoate polyprenyltransferase